MCVCCNIIQLYCMHVVLIVCCCMYMLSVLIAMCCMHVVLIVCCCVVCVVCIYSCCCTYVCTGKEERLWPIVRLIIIKKIIIITTISNSHPRSSSLHASYGLALTGTSLAPLAKQTQGVSLTQYVLYIYTLSPFTIDYSSIFRQNGL